MTGQTHANKGMQADKAARCKQGSIILEVGPYASGHIMCHPFVLSMSNRFGHLWILGSSTIAKAIDPDVLNSNNGNRGFLCLNQANQ
ncbi:hypothetical protein DAI22_01g332200 [Oryza sativa Japonica Group]|uniref:Uncharacterized protein n=2 Tax=Oryza TaxID=4527 RepID=A0A0E0N2P9_ORYRU|nr:hypothetical protein DAI22_01g332200 [Oryza sativa Japonica Group]